MVDLSMLQSIYRPFIDPFTIDGLLLSHNRSIYIIDIHCMLVITRGYPLLRTNQVLTSAITCWDTSSTSPCGIRNTRPWPNRENDEENYQKTMGFGV